MTRILDTYGLVIDVKGDGQLIFVRTDGMEVGYTLTGHIHDRIDLLFTSIRGWVENEVYKIENGF